MKQTTKEKGISRRGLLGKLLFTWGALSAIPVLNVIVRYLAPSEVTVSQSESLRIESFREIGENSAKVVRFGKEPAIIIHTETGQYKAFMARCTHLGCVVKYETHEVPHMNCNCHGSVFDMTGKNLTGPAPRPLEPLRVVVDGEALVLSRISRA
jgi:cytochrome b6-f complex iron-sulfur subunit